MATTANEVFTVYSAVDKMSPVFKKISAQSDTLSSRIKKNFKKATGSVSQFGSVLGGVVGGNLITQGINRLGSGVGTVTQEILDFDQSITSAASKFPEMVQRGTKNFEALSKAARDAGGTTEFTAAQAAIGLKEMAKAGFSVDQAIAGLIPLVNASTAAEKDLADTTTIVTKALGAFELRTDDPKKLAQNMNLVSDTLSKLANSATTDMDMIFEAMKRSGPVVAGAGGSIQDFAAMVGTLADNSIDASVAGTSINKIILRLAKPTTEARRQIRKLGLSYKKLGGPDIIGDLAKLNKAMEKLTTKQKTRAAAAIFGTEGLPGVKVLLRTAGGDLQNFKQKMLDAGGSTAQTAELMRTSMANRLAVLKSTMIDLGFRVVDTFMNDIPGGIEAVISAVKNFNIDPIVQGLIRFKEIAVSTIDFVKKNIQTIKLFGVAFLGLSVLTKIIPLFVAIATPVGAIATGFIALTSIIIIFRKQLEPFINIFKGNFLGIFNDLKFILGDVGEILSIVIGSTSSLWETIKPGLVLLTKLASFLFMLPLKWLILKVKVVTRSLKLLFKFFEPEITAVRNFIGGVIDWITTKVGNFVKMVGDAVKKIKIIGDTVDWVDEKLDIFSDGDIELKPFIDFEKEMKKMQGMSIDVNENITRTFDPKIDLQSPVVKQELDTLQTVESVFNQEKQKVDINLTINGLPQGTEAITEVDGAPGINMATAGAVQ